MICATAECPNCRATIAGELQEPVVGITLTVDIDLRPCEGSIEKHMLCASCRKVCYFCELDCCEEHSMLVPSVLEQGRMDRICDVCVKESETE